MKKLIFLFFIFISTAQGYETQGMLENLGKETQIKEADSFGAKLTLWPYDATDEKSFYDLEGKDFLDFFLISRVSKVKRSENNNRAVEIYLTLVLKNFFIMDKFYIFNHRDINIPVEIKGVVPARRELKTKEFFIKDEEPIGLTINIIFYLIPIVLIIAIAGIVYKRRKGKETEVVDSYIVKKISSRDDLEELFRYRSSVLSSYPDKEGKINKLLAAIDHIQYKESWSDEEFESVLKDYDSIFFPASDIAADDQQEGE